MVRKGNKNLLENHVAVDNILVWDKSKKFKNLFRILKKIRKENFDLLVNAQRFFSSGFLTAFSKAKNKIGFDKNPLSFYYDKKVKHRINIEKPKHEVERNLDLISHLVSDTTFEKPKLYPSEKDKFIVNNLINKTDFFVIAPASVWFTKQLQKEKWIDLVEKLLRKKTVYIIGAKIDFNLAEEIKNAIVLKQNETINLCGKLTLLQSAYLMQKAKQVFVNDSAPLHLASAVNANTVSFFCSTIPAFGFYSLSDKNQIIEVKNLGCKPCGLHGKTVCPKKHFNCSSKINLNEINFEV